MVGHGVHKAPLGQLPQPVSERGGRDALEAGQVVHGGQGRRAEQQDRLLQPLAQGVQVGVGRQAGEVNLVRNFVRKLRAKLGDDAQSPAWIFSVRGVGYRMPDPRGPARQASRGSGVSGS